MKREFSSGGVVYKKDDSQSLWLVTKSTPSELYPKGFWRLPKGWLDDTDGGKKTGPLARGDMRASEEVIRKAALREVKEEGGVKAKIIKKIGTEKYFSTIKGEKILKFVTFYLMEWLKDLPVGPGFETEEVSWLGFEEARKRLTHSGEKKILDKAHHLLSSGLQENLL